MRLTPKQQKIVESNMGLVGKVIKDKVRGLGQMSVYTYDDLFQIGCIGLCKAAATDMGGCFSTYAYRLIWNEICDELIRSTRLAQREAVMDPRDITTSVRLSNPDPILSSELRYSLAQAKKNAKGVVAKGIACLEMSILGYSSQEIGTHFQAEAATVRLWMTKARRFLRGIPELQTSVKEGLLC